MEGLRELWQLRHNTKPRMITLEITFGEIFLNLDTGEKREIIHEIKKSKFNIDKFASEYLKAAFGPKENKNENNTDWRSDATGILLNDQESPCQGYVNQ